MLDENYIFVCLLYLFYLVECLKIKSTTAVVFKTNIFLKWTAIFGETFFSSVSNCLIFLNPFPPFGSLIRTEEYLFSFSLQGVYCNSIFIPLKRQSLKLKKYYAFDNIESVHVNNARLSINGDIAYTLCSNKQAMFYANIINCMRHACLYDRKFFLELFIENSFDIECFSEKYNAIKRSVLPLIALCSLLFVYIFLEIPMILLGAHYALSLFCFLLFFILFIMAPLIFYSIKTQDIDQEAWHSVLNDIVKYLISPLSIIRISERFISKHAPVLNPLVPAYSLLDDIKFKIFTQNYLSNLRNCSFQTEISSIETETLCYFHDLLWKYISEHMEDLFGLNMDTIFKPITIEYGCIYFCPHCYQQYSKYLETCPKCGSNHLVKIES